MSNLGVGLMALDRDGEPRQLLSNWGSMDARLRVAFGLTEQAHMLVPTQPPG